MTAFFPQYFWMTDFSLPDDLGTAPQIEYIAENIKDAINAITVENGFNQTLVAKRPRRNIFESDEFLPEDKKVVIMQGEDKAMDSPVGHKQWQQTFILTAFVIDSDDAAASIDTRINQVKSDIEKKLKEDVYRNGYALDTDVEGSTFFDSEGFSGVEIKVLVDYRVSYGNPYA
jgi:hypothetical protein